jgi:stress-induced morphogen
MDGSINPVVEEIRHKLEEKHKATYLNIDCAGSGSCGLSLTIYIVSDDFKDMTPVDKER